MLPMAACRSRNTDRHKMKLANVLRHPSALSANGNNTSTTTTATTTTTIVPPATACATVPSDQDAPSPTARRRSILFRGLRRSSSKQKLASDLVRSSGVSPKSITSQARSTQASDKTSPTQEDVVPSIQQSLPALKINPPVSDSTSQSASSSRDDRSVSLGLPSPLARPTLQQSPLRNSYTTSPTRATIAASSSNAAANRLGEDYFSSHTSPLMLPQPMARRRIWVRRPGATPTQVHINEDDLVDDLKDLILNKYGNSLGRSYDSPDVTVKLVPRERNMAERALGPDEPMVKTLEACFPGGQAMDEALVIDVPIKRTPKPSPRIMGHSNHYFDDHRPHESGTDYFPPMPAQSPSAARDPNSLGHDTRLSHHGPPHGHSIAIIETGQIPALPSPGARKTPHRPRLGRTHTSSPTYVGSSGQVANLAGRPGARVRRDSDHQRQSHIPVPAPPLPTPPTADLTSANTLINKAATPPVERMSSPRPNKTRRNRKSANGEPASKKGAGNNKEVRDAQFWPGLPPGILDNSVPPINVLIVEDNIINLKLLEQLARKLKIRWSTAMNGRDAVLKWRTGGFHLVLMDIQLPIMNGLEATKEIRRLERLNGIAVFARSEGDESQRDSEINNSDSDKDEGLKTAAETDKLDPDCMIKSPVIIVALTASSLQSDRHEALAAGCNDFLTKPVNTVWFERKVMEWGCMQALIDFEGWRKWKDLSQEQEREKRQREKSLTAEEVEKRRKKDAKRAALLAKMGQA